MSIKERNESTQKQIELDRYNLEGEMKTNIVYQNIFFLSPLSRWQTLSFIDRNFRRELYYNFGINFLFE